MKKWWNPDVIIRSASMWRKIHDAIGSCTCPNRGRETLCHGNYTNTERPVTSTNGTGNTRRWWRQRHWRFSALQCMRSIILLSYCLCRALCITVLPMRKVGRRSEACDMSVSICGYFIYTVLSVLGGVALIYIIVTPGIRTRILFFLVNGY